MLVFSQYISHRPPDMCSQRVVVEEDDQGGLGGHSSGNVYVALRKSQPTKLLSPFAIF